MKFGTRLQIFIQREWGDVYIDYQKLKKLIEKDSEQKNKLISPGEAESQRDEFLQKLESNVRIVERWAEEKINVLRERLHILKKATEEDSKLAKIHDPTALFDDDDIEDQADDELTEETPLVPKETFHKRCKQREKQLLRLLEETLLVQVYCDINAQAIKKISKKFNKKIKFSGAKIPKTWISDQCSPKSFLHKAANSLREIVSQVEDEHTKVCLLQDVPLDRALAAIAKTKIDTLDPTKKMMPPFIVKWNWLAVAFVFATLVHALPIFIHDKPAHHCLVLLAWITVVWITECLPFFVGGMCVVLVACVGCMMMDENQKILKAKDASKEVFGTFFNDTVFLILGGFSLAASFAKCQFELRLADAIHLYFGHSPKLFILAVMFLGLFLSMWISNVTAPVLLTSVLTPILHDLPTDSRFARSLLLGLAISCNLGGMVSPISSPQNAVALGYLEDHWPDQAINFVSWVKVAAPFCSLCVLVSWAYLVFVLKPNDISVVPKIPYKRLEFKIHHYLVILVSFVTILLWCIQSHKAVRHMFGGMGTISTIPFILLFGSGILTREDLKAFSWNMIILVGSGNVLGKVISSSQLLKIISDSAAPLLQSLTAWLATVCVLVLVFVVSTFVSHTVSAMMLTPVIVSLGQRLGNLHPMVMTSTLMMSGTMSLPMSSFPNVNSLLVVDDYGKPYIHPMDYLQHGSVIAVTILVLLSTVGYALIDWLGVSHIDI
eukprot:gb/GEZN01003046.1/.p1 GENE.gb/GEZN01003046.1/~~gb/GEZN01003046.1/.p1  ORF type:complete len:721 (+),score=71.83 gb/GEZN01003046.1/:87-2249(+)